MFHHLWLHQVLSTKVALVHFAENKQNGHKTNNFGSTSIFVLNKLLKFFYLKKKKIVPDQY